MLITIAGIEFTYFDWDPRGDTLFLSVGPPPKEMPPDALETSEGHVVEYDERGKVLTVELMNVRWTLERESAVTVSEPPMRFEAEQLEPMLTSA